MKECIQCVWLLQNQSWGKTPLSWFQRVIWWRRANTQTFPLSSHLRIHNRVKPLSTVNDMNRLNVKYNKFHWTLIALSNILEENRSNDWICEVQTSCIHSFQTASDLHVPTTLRLLTHTFTKTFPLHRDKKQPLHTLPRCRVVVGTSKVGDSFTRFSKQTFS